MQSNAIYWELGVLFICLCVIFLCVGIVRQVPPITRVPSRERRADGPSGLTQKNVDKYKQGLLTSLYVATPAIVIYIGGVLFLMRSQGWPYMTANYVIAQTVTTVGYGDFVVNTDSAKVFMAIYSFCVLIWLAHTYNNIVGQMVHYECKFILAHLRRLEVYDRGSSTDVAAAKQFSTRNRLMVWTFILSQVLLAGMVFFRLFEHCSCSYGEGIVLGCREPDFDTCVVTGGYVKTWADCFYMSSITMTTIGFGDYQPRTQTGRILGTLWMLVGTACTVGFISAVTAALYESDQRKKLTIADVSSSITENTFRKIDTDGNGFLSRGEFLSFTLSKYGLVPDTLLEDISKQYDSLDTQKSNSVSWDTIRQRQHELSNNARR